jgi:hypothetical protein
MSQRKQLMLSSAESNIPKWVLREDKEIVVNAQDIEITKEKLEEKVMIQYVKANKQKLEVSGKDNSKYYSISDLSLQEISDATSFSLDYLGDFMIQLGCPAPLNKDEKIGNLLTGNQIYELLEAINTLDPYDADIGYDSVSVKELADELDVNINRILKIIGRENFHLPFGLETVLHRDCIERIKNIIDYNEYEDAHRWDADGVEKDNERSEDDDGDDEERKKGYIDV